jgi:hypothetical protein
MRFRDFRNPQNRAIIRLPQARRPNLASKKAHTGSGRRAEPRVNQELIDDQKFQVKIENKRFVDGIVREANKFTACPNCGDNNWRMQPKFWASIVMNSLLAVMVCCRCKRKVFFETQIEKDETDEHEEEYEGSPFPLFGTGPTRRRGPDFDQRLRFLRSP